MLRSISLTAVMACVGCIDIGDIRFDCVEECGGGGTGGSGAGGDGAVTYFDVVMADAPVGYWRLDAVVDATRTPDESGAGRHANLGQTDGEGTFDFEIAGAIANDPNGAATIAAGGELFVGPAHPFAFGNGAAYTIEFWVKIAPTTGAQLMTCQTSGTVGYQTFVLPGALYHKRHDAIGGFDEMTAEPFGASEYQHIVLTFDPTVGQGQGQIFQNGAVLFLPPRDMPLRWDSHGSALSLVKTAPTDVVTLDEIAIYDKVLPVERVTRHYECGKSGACE